MDREYVEEQKTALEEVVNSLPKEKLDAVMEWFDCHSAKSVVNHLINSARQGAQDVKEYADRHDYGYGEVGYNLNLRVDSEIDEDFEELRKPYKRLLNAYFELYTEVSEL